MIRWVDVRNALPPRAMVVLVYTRSRLELFEGGITSGRCFYDAKRYSLEHDLWSNDNISWSLKNSSIPKMEIANIKDFTIDRCEVAVENIDEDDYEDMEVTHWTLIPAYSASEWVDIWKYPPPPDLRVLIYMKDSCEDTEDFITSTKFFHSKIRNSTHENNPGKYFYRPILWTLYPPMPKFIDDTFV